MKRTHTGVLLMALAGVLLMVVINSNRDPIAVLEEFGADRLMIERNDQGEVVEVHLVGLKVTDAGLVHLKGMTKLETLKLQLTNITDAGLVHLKGLTKLQTLTIGSTKVTDAGLVHLKGMTGLQTLSLAGTKVTDAGLVHLKGLTKLQRLSLIETNVTDTGVADLKKALPNCKIIK